MSKPGSTETKPAIKNPYLFYCINIFYKIANRLQPIKYMFHRPSQ